MRKVRVEDLVPGMKVAKPIYYNSERLLLGVGMTLTNRLILRLKYLGIASLYIDDGVFPPIPDAPTVISQEMRRESIKVTREVFASLEGKRKIKLKAVRKTVESLLEEILSHKDVLINCNDIRNYDDYTFNHSVNVCVLSIMAGTTLGLNNSELIEMGVGALLHDVGKTQIEKAILNKPTLLTEEEYEKVKCHPQLGYDILCSLDDVPRLSATIAYQHHERLDGHGYPLRLKAEQIHQYSSIAAVADVFDALTTDRPYRKACQVNEAIDWINEMSPAWFELSAALALVSNLAPYPVGTVVMLNNCQVGQVIDVSRKAPDRPLVRIVIDEELNYHPLPQEVDLSQEASLYISRVLTEAEITAIINRMKNK
ncbi:MAG: HD-GYP domain-containing protein [Syntrophomonadaceae bacterium]|jgi:HD-GYP domain-containing protein (c-di-GMP phosphodiesterase class II)